MEYEIVEMKACHVCQVAALEQSCFSDPWSAGSVASELDNPLSLWLVAQAGDEVLGYVGSQSVLGDSDMMNLAVSPAWRRRGVARALVTALINALAARGIHSLTLEVRPSNEAARSLYAELGFLQVGCRKGYYLNPKEDGEILRKEWSL